MMCLANLIGFGSGHDGMKILLDKYISWEGLLAVLYVIIFKDVHAASLGFGVRAREKFEF